MCQMEKQRNKALDMVVLRYKQGIQKKKSFFPRMLTEKNKTALAGKEVIEEVTRIKAV